MSSSVPTCLAQIPSFVDQLMPMLLGLTGVVGVLAALTIFFLSLIGGTLWLLKKMEK